jgi:hypothetical protein
MIHELRQPIEVNTPLGDGLAIIVIDYGAWVNTCWVVVLTTGQIKHFDANLVTVKPNGAYSIGE